MLELWLAYLLPLADTAKGRPLWKAWAWPKAFTGLSQGTKVYRPLPKGPGQGSMFLDHFLRNCLLAACQAAKAGSDWEGWTPGSHDDSAPQGLKLALFGPVSAEDLPKALEQGLRLLSQVGIKVPATTEDLPDSFQAFQAAKVGKGKGTGALNWATPE